MELLVIFVIISAIDKIFKSKKDQKNIQEARSKRMANENQAQGPSGNQAQTQNKSQRQKPKSFAEKIREEIERSYGELEKGMSPKPNMKTSVSRKTVEKNIMERSQVPSGDERYISDYNEPYETHSGEGSMQGKPHHGGRYVADYDKPYESHGRKTGTQEGKTYKDRDEDFYKRREKAVSIMDTGSPATLQQQILSGIIFSEIIGKPKSRQ